MGNQHTPATSSNHFHNFQYLLWGSTASTQAACLNPFHKFHYFTIFSGGTIHITNPSHNPKQFSPFHYFYHFRWGYTAHTSASSPNHFHNFHYIETKISHTPQRVLYPFPCRGTNTTPQPQAQPIYNIFAIYTLGVHRPQASHHNFSTFTIFDNNIIFT